MKNVDQRRLVKDNSKYLSDGVKNKNGLKSGGSKCSYKQRFNK